MSDKIIAASMYISNTVDERIYSLLYERISLVEESVGLMEPILGQTLADFQRDVIEGHLSEEQVELRVKEIELAIEQSKIEMERFEANRNELMGEEFLTNPLHALERGNDFVAPSDAARLSDLCLNQWDGCRFESVDADLGIVTLSKTLMGQLEQFMRRPGSEGSSLELGALLQQKPKIRVVFNGSLADKFKDHVFIAPSGFWVRFLIRELEDRGKMRKVFALRSSSVREVGLEIGQYVVPFFEVKIEGIRVELNMAAVPIRRDSLLPVPCDYEALSRTLAHDLNMATDLNGGIGDVDLNAIIDTARNTLAVVMEGKVSGLRNENSYRIEARMNSLQRGAEIRIDRIMKQMREHLENSEAQGKSGSEEFLRLKEAQIANDADRTADKIRKLQEQKEVSFSISLIAVVVLDIYRGREE